MNLIKAELTNSGVDDTPWVIISGTSSITQTSHKEEFQKYLWNNNDVNVIILRLNEYLDLLKTLHSFGWPNPRTRKMLEFKKEIEHSLNTINNYPTINTAQFELRRIITSRHQMFW